MNLDGLTISTDLIWAAANDALDLESLDVTQVDRIIDVAFLLLARRGQRKQCISSASEAKNIFRAMIGKERHEVFAAMYMDNQNRIMEIVKHFHGTVNAANVRNMSTYFEPAL